MKGLLKMFSIIAAGAMILSGCAKESTQPQSPQAANGITPHTYGLQDPDPSRFSGVPVFDATQIDQMFSKRIDQDASLPIPTAYSLVTPAVRDQEQIGSCTGFCGTEANEILHYYANGKSFGPVLSPLYLYYIERVKIQHQSITADNGAQMVDIPLALQGYGECIETDYAYPVNAYHTASKSSAAYQTAPNAAAVSNALLYKIGTNTSNYGMVAQGDTAAVKALLRKNIPVCVGLNIYDNSSYSIFEGLNKTNYTYSPLTSSGTLKSGLSLLGGHANIIYGYDDTKGVFLMENSWSTGWGNNGYWYLPYSVFRSSQIVPRGNVYWMTLN